ncbi:MAG TPA: succinate dehydrogenase hydrophobic membrane anchor subunit [Actinomycetota bacterium]|nr:succinate dehydrogenase hydrophobic membrane anchor subunit [Actinomycetota bacterium]
MAVDTDRPGRPVHRKDSLGTGLPYRAGRQPPRKATEFWWWVFMRVSGILLLVLAVGHVLIMHVLGDGVDRVNFAFVALRWQSPFWQTWDWLLLSLALIHGINGLRTITLDYVRRPGVRVAINGFFAVTGVVLFALGSIVVFTFDPSKWPGAIPGS